MKILSVSLLTSMFATSCKSLSKGIGKTLHSCHHFVNIPFLLLVLLSPQVSAQHTWTFTPEILRLAALPPFAAGNVLTADPDPSTVIASGDFVSVARSDSIYIGIYINIVEAGASTPAAMIGVKSLGGSITLSGTGEVTDDVISMGLVGTSDSRGPWTWYRGLQMVTYGGMASTDLQPGEGATRTSLLVSTQIPTAVPPSPAPSCVPVGGSCRVFMGALELSLSSLPANALTGTLNVMANITQASPEPVIGSITHNITQDSNLNTVAYNVDVCPAVGCPVSIGFGEFSYDVTEGQTVVVTAILSGALNADVTVPLRVPTGLTAPATVTFAAGETAQTIIVTATDNAMDAPGAPPETTTVTLEFGTLPTGVARSETTTINIFDDDSASITLAVNPTMLAEGGGATNITVTATLSLDAALTNNLTLPLALMDGTATSADYSAGTLPTIMFSSGATSGATQTANIMVTATDDNIVEIAETVMVGGTASDPTFGVVPATIMLTDTDTTTLSITGQSAAVNEGEPAMFTVTLSNEIGIGVDITVAWSTGAGGPTGTVTLPPGTTSQMFFVTVPQDNRVETGEMFTVTLGATGGLQAGRATVNTSANSATVSVTDDDTRGVTFQPTSLIATGGEGTYTVRLNSEPTGNVTITPSSNTTATVMPSSLTFTTGNWNTPQTLTVSGVVAGTATTITHTVTGADTGYNGITLAPVTVGRNDVPTANAGNDQSVLAGALVTLDGTASSDPENAPLVYTWSQTAGPTVALSDPNTAMPTFTAPSGLSAETMLTFSLVVNDGIQNSPVNTVTITVSAFAESDVNRTGTLDRDDGLAIYYGVAFNFILTADQGTRRRLLSDLITGNDPEYLGLIRRVNTWQGNSIYDFSQSGSVDSRDALLVYYVTAFGVGLDRSAAHRSRLMSNLVSSADDNDAGYLRVISRIRNVLTSGNPGRIAMGNDIDDGDIVVTPATLTITEGNNAAIMVSLSSEVSSGLISSGSTEYVNVGISVDAACTVSPESLVFTASDWNMPQAVTVTSVDDGAAGATSCNITLATGTSRAIDIQALASRTDLFNPAYFDISRTIPVTVNEQNMLVLTPSSIDENGGMSTVTATLNRALSEEIVLTVLATPGTNTVVGDFTLAGTTLTFPVGQTDSTGTVTITAVDNNIQAADKTVTVSAMVTGGTATAPADRTLTIPDDDSPPRVTLALTPATINESGATNVSTVTATLNRAPSQEIRLTVLATADAPAVAGDFTLAGTTLTFPMGQTDSTGTVTITAVDNNIQAADKTVTVSAMVSAGMATAPANEMLTITDDDSPPRVTLALTPATINESGATNVSTVTATLNRAPSQEITLTVSAMADAPAVAGDFTLAGTTLTFPMGQTASTGTVTITAVNNNIQAADKTVMVSAMVTSGMATAPADQTLTITDDDDTPTVSSISRQTPATETTNADTVVWQIVFSKTVVNVDAADFSLSGSTATLAVAGSGSTYTVTASGGDLAGLSGTITLMLASTQNIEDSSSNALTVTTPTGVNENSYILDNTDPGITSISRQTPATETTNADTVVWQIVFSETVSNVDAADFSLSGSTATPAVTGSGSTYTVTASGGDLAGLNGTVTLAFASTQDIADSISNTLTNTTPTGVNENSYLLDNTAPTVTITAPTSVALAVAFTATFAFNEDVTGFGATDITVTNGTVMGNVQGSGMSYTAMIMPSALGAVTIDVAANVATDAAGNSNTAATQVTATAITAPGLTIAAPSPVNSPFTATFTFTASVTGFAVGDITVSNGAASNFSGSGDSYTATITPNPGVAGTIIDVAANVAEDAAGNGNTVATQISVTVDTAQPTVSIARAGGETGTVNDAFDITVTFSEAVTGFAVGDITVGNGAASNLQGSGTSYMATITPTAGVTGVTIDVAANVAIDAAGNGNTVAAQISVTVDNAAPMVNNVASTTSNGTYGDGDTIDITITFTEAVTVSGTPQLLLETGSTDRMAVYQSGSGTATLSFQYAIMLGDSSADLDYSGTDALSGGTIRDEAGNDADLILPAPGATGSLGANASLVIDSVPVIVRVSGTDGSYDEGDPVDIRVQFSEEISVPSGFDDSNLQLRLDIGATGRMAVYRADLTLQAGGSVTDTLVFRYMVEADDSSNDLDYSSTTALVDSYAMGNLSETGSGRDAVLTLPAPGTAGSLSHSSNIRVGVNIEMQNERLNDMVLTQVTQVVTASALSAITQRIDTSIAVVGNIPSAPPPSAPSPSAPPGTPPPTAQFHIAGLPSLKSLEDAARFIMPMLEQGKFELDVDLRQVLANSSFQLPLNVSADGKGNSAWGLRQLTLWGSGDYNKLSDDDEGLDYDGDSYGVNVGADAWISDTLLLGVGFNWSDAAFDYGDSMTGQSGDYDYMSYGVNPYISWTPVSRKGNLWASIGYGIGEIENQIDGVDDEIETDTRQYQLSAGGKQLLTGSDDGLSQLYIKGDISLLQVDVEEATGFEQVDINTQTVRLLLSGSHNIDYRHYSLTPSLETGLRYDLGDGDTGSGIELNPAINYRHKTNNITAELRGRYLLAGQYDRWGLSLLVRIDPGAYGEGLSLSVAPGWGQVGSTAEQLWSDNTSRFNQQTAARAAAQLNTEISYGMALANMLEQSQVMFTPYAKLVITATDRYQLDIGQRFIMGKLLTVEMSLRQQRLPADRDYQLLLNKELRF